MQSAQLSYLFIFPIFSRSDMLLIVRDCDKVLIHQKHTLSIRAHTGDFTGENPSSPGIIIWSMIPADSRIVAITSRF